MGDIQEGFDKFKAWWQSRTIIGVVIAAVSAIVKGFWPEIDVQGATDVVIEEGGNLATSVDQIWLTIVEVIGLAVAAWGRFKAKVSIK